MKILKKVLKNLIHMKDLNTETKVPHLMCLLSIKIKLGDYFKGYEI